MNSFEENIFKSIVNRLPDYSVFSVCVCVCAFCKVLNVNKIILWNVHFLIKYLLTLCTKH